MKSCHFSSCCVSCPDASVHGSVERIIDTVEPMHLKYVLLVVCSLISVRLCFQYEDVCMISFTLKPKNFANILLHLSHFHILMLPLNISSNMKLSLSLKSIVLFAYEDCTTLCFIHLKVSTISGTEYEFEGGQYRVIQTTILKIMIQRIYNLLKF